MTPIGYFGSGCTLSLWSHLHCYFHRLVDIVTLHFHIALSVHIGHFALAHIAMFTFQFVSWVYVHLSLSTSGQSSRLNWVNFSVDILSLLVSDLFIGHCVSLLLGLNPSL